MSPEYLSLGRSKTTTLQLCGGHGLIVGGVDGSSITYGSLVADGRQFAVCDDRSAVFVFGANGSKQWLPCSTEEGEVVRIAEGDTLVWFTRELPNDRTPYRRIHLGDREVVSVLRVGAPLATDLIDDLFKETIMQTRQGLDPKSNIVAFPARQDRSTHRLWARLKAALTVAVIVGALACVITAPSSGVGDRAVLLFLLASAALAVFGLALREVMRRLRRRPQRPPAVSREETREYRKAA